MASSETRPPTVFISYSHDSKGHADRVLALSDHLRADGIDCILDQYEDAPPEGFPRWMDRHIRAADFVLMICTPTYYRRVMGEEEPGKGHGVAWESTLIYQYIYNEGTSNARFIPVLLQGGQEADIPMPWQGVKHYRPTTQEGYEELYRRLTGQPLTPKPALGMLREMPPRKRTQDFVEHVPDETHQEYAVSENSEPRSEKNMEYVPSLRDSIILVTSSNTEESSFGTGFIFHRDEQGTYVLTCAHVVKDVGGPEKVMAKHIPASLVALGSEKDIDLAVLRVEGLQDKPLLHLSPTGKTGDKFTTIGFRENDKQRITVSLEGILGKKVGIDAIEQNEYLEAWSVGITDKDQLQPGNSGSPVVDQGSGLVIAVISHRGGKGETGFAISIKALKEIWKDRPPSLFQEAELETIPGAIKETDGTQREVQTQGTTVELLTQEERETLIALLCELPNINYANVRHSLVSTLPARFQGNIAFHKPAKTHITEIIDVITSDASFRLPDGSYPVIVLIQNALNIVKKSQLREKLQLLLKNLKNRLGVAPQIDAGSTSLNRFIQYLDNFILQMPAIQFELRRISASFNAYICQRDCDNLSTHLADLCAPIPEFNTFIKQFHDSKIVSNRLLLMEALQDFNKHAKDVQNSIDNFCMKYGSLLERYQPVGEREKIQQQLNKLWQRFYGSVLDAAQKLYGELSKQ